MGITAEQYERLLSLVSRIADTNFDLGAATAGDYHTPEELTEARHAANAAYQAFVTFATGRDFISRPELIRSMEKRAAHLE